MPNLAAIRRFLPVIALAVGGGPSALLRAEEAAAWMRPAPAVIIDVALNRSTFVGRTVDPRGRSRSDVEVVVRQRGREVARSMTDVEGWFAIPQIAAGQYELTAGGVVGTYRLWPERVAPPTAGEHALIVLSRQGGRGVAQPATGDGTVLVTVGIIGAVIGVAIAVDRVHRLPPTV